MADIYTHGKLSKDKKQIVSLITIKAQTKAQAKRVPEHQRGSEFI